MSSKSTSISAVNKKPANLVEVLRRHSTSQPEATLFTFLNDGEEEARSLTYGELDRWARAIASRLQALGLKGERALLLYPPGLEYIAGFFGCLYAGVIAVPAYPPDPDRLKRTLPRLAAIIKDCRAKVILTTDMIQAMSPFILEQTHEFTGMEWLATDLLPLETAINWVKPDISPEHLAFLQYTSGSTGEPKGVMLSHANLMHNLGLIREGFGVDSSVHGVSWLPPYHDMGLIGGILEPTFLGVSSTLISPLHFLQKPLRWLKNISRHKKVISGGPNFAFEMCLRKISPEQRATLDLSHWELAFTGAEPVLPQTLDRFVEAFGPCGFRREVFYPCYGLAEGTLMVTGGFKGQGPKIKQIHLPDPSRQSENAGRGLKRNSSWTGCGKTFPGQKVVIVDPQTLEPCPEEKEGEIWVQGPSVARGYWEQQEKSREIFQARIGGSGEGPFLRTGDLGFLDNGELYVTGRLKDLILIRGNNHYPQDIERTVAETDHRFRPGSTAAFSISRDSEEKLVVVQEIDLLPGETPAEVFEDMLRSIRKQVALHHDLEVHSVVFLKKGMIPKTSSGKIRRFACRDDFLKGRLETIYEFQAPRKRETEERESSKNKLEEVHSPPSTIPTSRIKEIEGRLLKSLADLLGKNPEDFDPRQPFVDYGLDSKDAINISGELEEWLGIKLSPMILWKYPTVADLARHLVSREDVPQVMES